MATTFLTLYDPDTILLTSQIESVKARTDQKKVRVSVVRDPGGDIDEFYSTSLYAFDGVVEFTGLGQLIEERFREKNRINDIINVVIDGEVLEFIAMYCEWVLNADFDHKQCFLVAAGTSVVHPDSVLALGTWNNGSNIYQVKAVGMDANGKIAMAERSFTRDLRPGWASFGVAEIIHAVQSRSENDTEPTLDTVAYFSISYGNMQKVFYIAHDPEYLILRYRNIFNIPEYLDVTGTIMRKTKADRDLAVCSGKARHYNRVVSRSYEVSTGPLTLDQAREFEQMLASYKVELLTGSDDYPVIITDHTCEVDNDDDGLVTMKFSFTFDNSRPILTYPEMGALLHPAGRIFTEQFTPEFS